MEPHLTIPLLSPLLSFPYISVVPEYRRARECSNNILHITTSLPLQYLLTASTNTLEGSWLNPDSNT